MDLNITTKFNVGQTVYKRKPAYRFIEGQNVIVWEPDETPYIVKSVRIHVHEEYTSVYYRLDGIQKSVKEKHLYSSLEEM